MKQQNDLEIDLFEMFQALWNGKRLISAFIVISVLLSGPFLFFRDVKYESKVIYSIDTIPPFYMSDRVFADFQQKFLSSSIFENWKRSNNKISLKFEDFSPTEIIDGIVLSKNEASRLLAIKSETANRSFILIRSNQLSLLKDVFDYADYVNKLLRTEYIARAKDDLNIYRKSSANIFNTRDGNTNFLNFLDTQRYVKLAEQGKHVFTIHRPASPVKKDLSETMIILLVALGGMVGAMCVLILNAIRKRKQLLTKT